MTDSDDLLVSVLLSTHNRATSLGAAVESVLQQDWSNLELLVIDDASTDDTDEVLARWADDERVRVFRNASNLGLPASLNRIAAQAQGELLARIDDDDRWTRPDKLSRQVAWMSTHPDGVLLGTGYVDEWGRETVNPQADEDIRRQMLLRCPFCHPSVLMRRAAFVAAGGYDESLPYAEDWEFWMRLGQQGRLGNLEDVTLEKARGGDTMSERYFQRQLSMASEFVAQHGGHYPGAMKARTFHAFNRAFFSVFPVDGWVHRNMGRVFRGVFRMDRGAD